MQQSIANIAAQLEAQEEVRDALRAVTKDMSLLVRTGAGMLARCHGHALDAPEVAAAVGEMRANLRALGELVRPLGLFGAVRSTRARGAGAAGPRRPSAHLPRRCVCALFRAHPRPH